MIWAPTRVGTFPRKRESGFTLVELMVALLIFGMLAAAGVGLLRFSVDAQAATKTRLDSLAMDRRIESLITSDAAQALPRITRDEAGAPVQAFEGGGDRFMLVRGGVDPMDATARSDLQKVEYRLDGDTLQRRAWPMLDGARAGPPIVMARNVRSISLRYRSKDGWREVWDPLKPDLLPRAIEMIVRPADGAEMRYMFLVGAGA